MPRIVSICVRDSDVSLGMYFAATREVCYGPEDFTAHYQAFIAIISRLDLGLDYAGKVFGVNLEWEDVLKLWYTYVIIFVAQLIAI